jgi:chemotaxis protein CheC
VSALPSTVLSDLELDALTELVNLGISKAAASLAGMVREEVILTVPKVSLVSREVAIQTLGAREARKLVAVHQIFEGDITGRALLIFPEARSLELVRAVVGGELSIEEIIEMEQEALAETGNIILNGCLATIANQLQRSLKISLPEILHGESEEFFNLAPPPDPGDTVMFIYINFAVRNRNIEGYIAMLLDMPSIVALKVLISEYIDRVAGDSPH